MTSIQDSYRKMRDTGEQSAVEEAVAVLREIQSRTGESDQEMQEAVDDCARRITLAGYRIPADISRILTGTKKAFS